MTFTLILSVVLSIFLMIGVGCLLRWLGVLGPASEKSIMQIVLNVLYPSLILSSVAASESLRDPTTVALAMGCGAGLTLTGIAVAYVVGGWLGLKSGPEQNTFGLAGAIQNYGFIPIPLISKLFPEALGAETLGVLFVHNLGLEIVLWTVGIILISGSIQGAWKRLINGPTVAILLGLTLNATGGYSRLPDPVLAAIDAFGQCAIPISLLLVGAALAGVLLESKWKPSWKVMAGSIGLRFALLPTISLALAWVVSSWSSPLMLVLMVQSAMPAAVFPIVLARHFGGKPAIAAQVVVASSLPGLVLTPGILMLANYLLPTGDLLAF